MDKSMELPLWLVLALQVQLDVHYVLLSDTTRPFAELPAFATTTADTVEDYLEFSKDMDVRTWLRQKNDVLRHILLDCRMWFSRDFLDDSRTICFQYTEQLKWGRDFVLLKRHPILCGMLLFRFTILKHCCGLSLANSWDGVPSILHLYNAVVTKGIVQPWMDMEALIVIYSAERIFIGERPRKSQDFIKRFLLAIGLSPSMFAANVRSHSKLIHSSKGPHQMMASPAIAAIYGEQYKVGPDQESALLRFTLSAIEKLLLKSAQVPDVGQRSETIHGSGEQSQITLMGAKFQVNDAAGKRKMPSQKSLKSHKLTVAQLLTALAESIEDESFGSTLITFHYT